MLTSEQLATLRAHIDATPELAAQPLNDDGHLAIAEALNQPSTFTVWKTSVSCSEIMSNGFVWTEVDALANGKARIWEWMMALGTINPSKSNIRQGLRDCFGNTSGTYTNSLPHLKRIATRAEQLYAAGTGTDQNPGTLTFEGPLSFRDVAQARAS